MPAVSVLAAFRSLSLNEKRRQVAALQRLPPFQVKWLIAFSFNLHSLQVIYGLYRLQKQETRWDSFPSLTEYRSGLPKRSRAILLSNSLITWRQRRGMFRERVALVIFARRGYKHRAPTEPPRGSFPEFAGSLPSSRTPKAPPI